MPVALRQSRDADATFDPFVERWDVLEPLIYERVDQLGAREGAQGTVEDFENLFQVVVDVLQDLALGVVPSPTERLCVRPRLERARRPH